MVRSWVHPMKHLVRIVHTDGSSVFLPVAWQRPRPGLEVTTYFMDQDFMSQEVFTGKPARAKKEGRRAQFENKFASKEKPKSEPKSETTEPTP